MHKRRQPNHQPSHVQSKALQHLLRTCGAREGAFLVLTYRKPSKDGRRMVNSYTLYRNEAEAEPIPPEANVLGTVRELKRQLLGLKPE
jgi:hypothetical protein